MPFDAGVDGMTEGVNSNSLAAVHGLFPRIVIFDFSLCKRVVVRTDGDLFPLLLAAAVIDGRKLVALVERKAIDLRNALGNDDLCKRGAGLKRCFTDAFHALGNGDLGKHGTAIKRISTDRSDALGERHAFQ